jgi:serine protease Do
MNSISSLKQVCLTHMSLCWFISYCALFCHAQNISDSDLQLVRNAESARMAAIEKVYGSVVAIYGNDRQGGGSGVLYHKSGYALTNHHVVAAAGIEGWAGLADGKLYRWKLYGTDPGGDVAIIKLEGNANFPTAPLADSNLVQIGDWAMAMGNPFVLAEDQRPTVTLGIVSGTKRYQPGDGLNLLVYGNCIQVDSSINPGNSGGPLFNLKGEVIGINGRGSFQERGRVNVGLGYAISANQVKNFVPDLLATRTVQHGTLDCQFGNRTGGVICQSINLNAPAARLGLALGDKLIEFEGVEIHNANEFTNLVSTYPADWPCEITFEQAGERKTIVVRLTPLPYDFKQPPAEQPKPQEDKQPAEEKKEDKKTDKPEAEKPNDKAPTDKPEIKIVKANAPALEPGKVRFPELNQAATQWLLQEWRGEESQATSVTVKYEVSQQNVVQGTVTLDLHGTAFRVDYAAKKENTSFIAGYDGKVFWKKSSEGIEPNLSFEHAMREPFVAHANAMLLWKNVGATSAIPVSLQGGDKAQQQVAYRLAVSPDKQDPLYIWLSVFNANGTPAVSLLKTGISLHNDEPIPAMSYRSWNKFQGHLWPAEFSLVTGLREDLQQSVTTISVSPFQPPMNHFQVPTP